MTTTTAPDTVTETPVNPTTSAGLIEPTEMVQETPEIPKAIPSGTIAPTLEVAQAQRPVRSTTTVSSTCISGPTEAVADTPLSPITSAGRIDPTAVVATKVAKP